MRRKGLCEDPVETPRNITYKTFPSVGPGSDLQASALFLGACSKCSPLSDITSVDPICRILGHVNLGEQPVGGNLVHKMLMSYYHHQNKRGIRISPGQLEVLGRAGQGMIVLLVTDHQLSNSELALVCLTLAYKVKLPSPLPTVLVPGLGNTWTERLLVRANLALPFREDLLRPERLRGLRGLIVTKFDSELVTSLRDRGLELLLAPVLLFQETGRGGGSIKVEFGQPLSLELFERNGWGLGHLQQHLSVNSQRMFQVSPAQLVAFILQTGHCPRHTSVAKLRDACQDLLELLNLRKVEIIETNDLADMVRSGVAVLGGLVDQDERVEINMSDIELWRLCRGLEERLLPECLVSIVVLRLAKPGLASTRTRYGPTVRQDEVIEKAKTVALLTGLESKYLAPCEDLHQLVTSGLDTLNLLGGLSPVKLTPPSQHGVRRKNGQMYRSRLNSEDYEDKVVTVPSLTVGETAKGRRILTWLAGVMRYKLTNLRYTTRALHSVRKMKVATMQEVVDRVREEIESKRSRGWKLSEKASMAELTIESLEALESAEVVTIIRKPGLQLLEVGQAFNSHQVLQELINLVTEI